MLKKLLLLIFPIFIIAWTPTTAIITGAWTTVCEERVTKTTTVTFKLHNTGGQALTACRLQTWVGPAETDWADVTVVWSTACASLAAGASTWASLEGQSHEKLRVQAQSTSGTTVYCRPYGN
jgi:hypothetical protein